MTGTFIGANNAGTTLGANLSSVATSMTVAPGTGALFPVPATGQYFAMTLFGANSASESPNEIVYCTARSGDTLTIQRAQEGSAAQSWNVGDNAQNLWTYGQAASLVQVAQLQVQATNWNPQATSSANAIVLTLTPAPVSLSSIIGSPIRFKKNGTNTGAPTLSINGFTATPITLPGSGALAAGALTNGAVYTVIYDGSTFELQSLPSNGLPLSGSAGGDLTGTYPNPVIGTNKVGNSKLAQVPGDTVKGNLTGSAANPADVTLTDLRNALGITLASLGIGFGSNSNGFYFQFGSQMIIQGGIGPSKSQNDGAYSVAFPIPFPDACRVVVGSIVNSAADASVDYILQVVSFNNTLATLFNNNVSSSGGASTPHTATWVAFGY